LPEHHGQELITAIQLSDLAIAIIFFDAAIEFPARDKIQNLRENIFAGIHIDN
jgi:hypothetical protein